MSLTKLMDTALALEATLYDQPAPAAGSRTRTR
jgi:hypothetical protein